MTNVPDPTESSPLADLLGKLQAEGFEPSRGQGSRLHQWKARCPAHDDKEPSLSISNGDGGKVLLKCHAGCPTENVLKALELSWDALFPEKTRTYRGGPRKAQRTVEIDDVTYGAVPAYLLLHGCTECIRLYGYLAWKCGKQNKPQRSLRKIASHMGLRRQTIVEHAEYLAACGWVTYKAEVTQTGARRASELALRHCPALRIVNPEALVPARSHIAKRTTVRQVNHSPASSASAKRTTRRPAKRTTELATVVRQAHHSLGTYRYEREGLGDARATRVTARDMNMLRAIAAAGDESARRLLAILGGNVPGSVLETVQ